MEPIVWLMQRKVSNEQEYRLLFKLLADFEYNNNIGNNKLAK